MPVEVKRGDTLIYEGREYVVISIQATQDYGGRALSLACKDPFIAQNLLDSEAARAANVRNSAKITELLPKLEKIMDE